MTATEREKRFDWPLCYDAEERILGCLETFISQFSFAAGLAARMRDATGTLFIDWVDHWVMSPTVESELSRVGYRHEHGVETMAGQRAFWHPEAMLPRVVLDPAVGQSHAPFSVVLRVDSIADFFAIHDFPFHPRGAPMTRYRKAVITREAGGPELGIAERRGYRGFVPTEHAPAASAAFLRAHELWRTRNRRAENDNFQETHALLDELVSRVGRDGACHVVFAEERLYWERRNRAAQVQKRRQDRLGLGWANHDHHTFRSSRDHFVDLMKCLEKLGFERRERYYAGAQAGWGAQILEQPVEGIVAFCDVDLEPHETEIDFSRLGLPPSKRLGTIGLWVGLHGESFLEAGMHHLECRFDHALLREQLAAENVNTMTPFSDFPFLKQAFTEGERWPVRRERAEALLKRGHIDQAQFDRFVTEGAIGSHLENLQRKGGFKGFNQKSVSVIIQATDPRAQPPPGS
ncbi:MAG: hypothetical protein L0Y58_09445 [Verrucomicrobia subdivision 3 bacterium]|nr:hypothetical protein [Limisphaerales bacterium]